MLKTGILAGVMLLQSSAGYAQDSMRVKKIYLGPIFSPDYSSALLTNTGLDPLRNDIQFICRKLQPKLSFTAGIEMLCELNQHLSLSFGMQYSIKDGMTNQGYLFDSTANGKMIKQDVGYLDLPVKLNYYLNGRSARTYYFTVGISPSLYLFENNVLRTQSGALVPDLGTLPDFNNGVLSNTPPVNNHFYVFNPQIQLGMGVAKMCMKKNMFKIEVVCRYSLYPANPPPSLWTSFGPPYELDCTRTFYSVGLAFSYLWGR